MPHDLPRVLLVNKFYYPRGGDCVVLLNTERLLRRHAHDVAVFAMQYDKNLPCEQQPYFADEVDFGGGIAGKVKAAARTLGFGDIRRHFAQILADFRPDVVHLHNVHSYLSPVVATMAHRAGARVVWTLHDYKLICPAYACLYNGQPCERCIGAGKMHVLKQRCMKGSLTASTMAWLEALRWNPTVLQQATDCFICPSQFMARKMQQGGFDSNKLRVINNFSNPPEGKISNTRDNYYCYVGRLSPEKGVATLLQVAALLPWPLRVAGDGPLLDELRRQYADKPHITFMGHLSATEVGGLLASAHASVMPSEWYENNPLGVIESLLAGTPVVGADIGGIPELLQPQCGENILNSPTGTIFARGNADALAEAIKHTMTTTWAHADIAAQAAERFSPQHHYEALIAAYGG